MPAEFFVDYFWHVFSLLSLLGLIVGSFLNVVIHRLPITLQQEWKKQSREVLNLPKDETQPELFNIAFPSSHCPSCQHKLAIWENIPIVSYLILRGKCRSCHQNISLRYPLIELVTGLLFGLIFCQYGLTPISLSLMLLSCALLCLTMIDLDHMLLPDQITLPVLWLGLLVNSQLGMVSPLDAVYGAMFGYLILWSVYWLFKLLTKKEGMGYGDFKLLAMLGAWFGWQAVPIMVFLSAFLGAFIGVSLILLKRIDRDKPIPYGPYLAIAGVMIIFWRDTLFEWYGIGIAG